VLQGQAAEHGSPHELLTSPVPGPFASLVDAAGPDASRTLRAAAAQAHASAHATNHATANAAATAQGAGLHAQL